MADTTKSTIELLIDTLNSSKNIQEVTKASKDLQKQLALAGQESKDFTKGASALANYKDKVGDVKNALAALDPDKKAQAFVGLGQGIVGSFSVATGALNLFGTKNEELNAIVGKTTQLISVLQGLNSIQQAAEQAGIIRSIFLKKADVVVTGEQVKKTVELTVAQRALNFTLGPIGIAVGIVTALAAVYLTTKNRVQDVTEVLKSQNLVIQTHIDLLEKEAKTTEGNNKRNLDEFKATLVGKEKLSQEDYTKQVELESKIVKDNIVNGEKIYQERAKQVKNNRTLLDLQEQQGKIRDAAVLTAIKTGNDAQVEIARNKYRIIGELSEEERQKLIDKNKELVKLNNALLENIKDNKSKEKVIGITADAEEISRAVEKQKQLIISRTNFNKAELDLFLVNSKLVADLLNDANKARNLDAAVYAERRIEIIQEENNREIAVAEYLRDEKKKLLDVDRKNNANYEKDVELNNLTVVALKTKLNLKLVEIANQSEEKLRQIRKEGFDTNLSETGTALEIENQKYKEKLKEVEVIYKEGTAAREKVEEENYVKFKAASVLRGDTEKKFADGLVELTNKKNFDLINLQEAYYGAVNILTENHQQVIEKKIKDEFDLEVEAQEKLNDLAKQKSQERVDLLRTYIAYTDQALQSLLSLNEIATNLEQQRLAQTELRTKQYYDHVTQVREQAYSVEQNALNAKYQKEYNAASGNAAKQQLITDKYNLASKKAEKDKVDYVNKLAYQRAQVEYQNAIERNRIAEIEFRRNKAFQISSAVINTAAGVAGALAHSGDETPPAAIAQSIAIGIAGAAQIAKIASTKFNPSDVGQPPVAPIVEPNLNASTSTNNLTNAAQKPLEFNTEFLTTGKLQGQQLIKVYVLESEITNVQNSVRAQISSNSF